MGVTGQVRQPDQAPHRALDQRVTGGLLVRYCALMIDRVERTSRTEAQPAPTPDRPDTLVRERRPIRFALRVGAVNDPAERAADAMADDALARLASQNRDLSVGGSETAPVGERVEMHASAVSRAAEAAPAQRVQRSAAGTTSGGQVSDTDAAALRVVARSGSPLPGSIRREMESGFGADLSAVRVHTGPQSDELNGRFGARAFAVGQDVFFGGGLPSMGTHAGRHLIAHELAHTLQAQPTVSRIVRRDTDTIVERRLTADDDVAALNIANRLRVKQRTKAREYAYSGLGGGGAHFWRSSEVRQFRGALKDAGRDTVFDELDQAIADDRVSDEPTATSEYQGMVGGNIAYKAVKGSVDTQLDSVAGQIAISSGVTSAIDRVHSAALAAAQASLLKHPGDVKKAAKKAAEAASKLEKTVIEATRVAKDAVSGKRSQDGERTGDQWGMTAAGIQVADDVQTRVSSDGIARKSLDKAIDASSMSAGLTILGKFIDFLVSNPGETLDLSIQFNIPTSSGVDVVIKMNGMIAKGTDGATTAGVTMLGDPNRVEVSAKFSVGVGAEAIGLSASATVGFFIRAGSNKGSAAALQALSYGAYRAAPTDQFKNLWAPTDKRSEHKKKQGKSHRSATERAEMWAAMVEEQYFGDEDAAFADLGIGADGAVGVNAGVASVDIGFGSAAFARYNRESMMASMGQDVFANPVGGEAGAKKRRKDATAQAGVAGYVSFATKIGVGSVAIEVGLSGSGASLKNWGIEATFGIGSVPGVTSAIEPIINGIANGLADLIKRCKQLETADDGAKAVSWLSQIPADVATIFDGASQRQLSEAIANISSKTVDNSGTDLELGHTGAVGTKTEALFEVMSSLQVAITFGMSDGKWVVRVELRSKRGIEIGKGTPVKFSGFKTTRLAAFGRDGANGIAAEVGGVRLNGGGA